MTRSVRALRRIARRRPPGPGMPMSFEWYVRWFRLLLGDHRLDLDDTKKLIRLLNGHARAQDQARGEPPPVTFNDL